MSEHTKAPWVCTGGTIESVTGWHIGWTTGNNSIANAHRIVACVNACEGMEDPEAEIKALCAGEVKDPDASVWKMLDGEVEG